MLAWHKAAQLRGLRLTREQKAAGWPALFHVEQLATLQSCGERTLYNAVYGALLEACRAGAVEHVKSVIPAPPATPRTDANLFQPIPLIGSSEWHDRGFQSREQERVYSPRKISLTPPVDKVAYQVGAAAFQKWLRDNKAQPSEHIAAWFADQLQAPRTGGLVGDVLAAAENDAIPQWLANVSGGAISVVQFLAVVLWVIAKEDTDAEAEALIITEWHERLCEAAAVRTGGWRLVQPYDRLTLLPMKGNPSGPDWVLAVDDADEFLKACGAGWRCSQVLTFWREHYGLASAPSSALADAAPAPASGNKFPVDQLPAHTKGDVWPDAKAQAVQKWVSENGRGALTAAANFYGVQPSALSSVLDRVKKSATTLDSWSKSRKTA